MAELESIKHVEMTDPSGKRLVGVKWVWSGTGHTCKPVMLGAVSDLTISIHGTVTAGSVGLYLGNVDNALSDGLLVKRITAKDLVSGEAISLSVDNTGSLVAETGVWMQPFGTNLDGDVEITVVGK